MSYEGREEQYPLFPELSEAGKLEAEKLVESFKKKLASAAEGVLNDFYAEILPYIESDAWTNYRNSMVEGFVGYSGRAKEMAQHDYVKLRRKMLDEHKEELQNDIIADLVAENESLKKQLQRAYAR